MTTKLYNGLVIEFTRRGRLVYGVPGSVTYREIVGEFYLRHYGDNSLNKLIVIARRKGGRNTWQLCDEADVFYFNEGEGWS